jgi:hypothetical protein
MKNFTVLYMMPPDGLAAWASKPESERKGTEDKMKEAWDAWMAAHAENVLNTIALGSTKRVTASGAEDVKNGMMLSSYVAAQSLAAAAELFADHPHLQIPGAFIEIMEARPMA